MNIFKNFKKEFLLLTSFLALLILFIVSTVYFLIFKNTHSNYSFTQSYLEYYSAEDWNLTTHVVTDIDGDGADDMLTFTNCAFLSSLSEEKIPSDERCEEPGMSGFVFGRESVKVGQKLAPEKDFSFPWLKKSYLVKTNDSVWKFYDINGLELRTFQLNDNLLFEEVSPTILDRFDVVTYQLSHVGVVLALVFFG